MNLAEYSRLDAVTLGELVREGSVSAEALAQAACDGIELLNPQLNAVIELWRDRVERCDESANLDGPFAGVPFLLKDIAVAEEGRLQEMGSRLFRGHISPFTTEFAKRLKATGLNFIGRTTCPDNAYSFCSDSIMHGPTRNPWDRDRICGGSSSGSAAAVSAGIVPMASASDGGGSIRIPASMCGLVGLKPSRGRFSLAPFATEQAIPEAVEGVLSRTVRDTAVAVYEAAGSDVGEFMRAEPPRDSYVNEVFKPRRYRIAVTLDAWGPFDAPPHIKTQVEETAELLEAMGHKVAPAVPAVDFDAFYEWFTLHWIGGTLALDAAAVEMGVELSADLLEPMLYEHVVRARSVTLADWLHKDQVMMEVTRDLDAFLVDDGFDLALTPALAVDTPFFDNPYRLDVTDVTVEEWIERCWSAVPYTALANATGVPAISVPGSHDGNGLPLGMHFFGRWGSESDLINIAAQMELARPWADSLPPLHISSGTVVE